MHEGSVHMAPVPSGVRVWQCTCQSLGRKFQDIEIELLKNWHLCCVYTVDIGPCLSTSLLIDCLYRVLWTPLWRRVGVATCSVASSSTWRGCVWDMTWRYVMLEERGGRVPHCIYWWRSVPFSKTVFEKSPASSSERDGGGEGNSWRGGGFGEGGELEGDSLH